MSARWISFAAVVVALTGYHLAQRAMPEGLRPAPLFAFVYGVATVVMLAVVTVERSGGGVRAVAANATHWAPWLLVVAIAGIELGVYAMYRSGWSIGTANTTTQALITVILASLGTVAFGEHLTPTKVAGLVLCVAGGSLVVGR